MSTWEKFADAKGHIHGKVIAVLVTIALVFSFTNIYVWDEAFGTDDEAATQEVAADETGAQDGIVEPDSESGSDGAIAPADEPAGDESATGGEPADGDSSEDAAPADDGKSDAADDADKVETVKVSVDLGKASLTLVSQDGKQVKSGAKSFKADAGKQLRFNVSADKGYSVENVRIANAYGEVTPTMDGDTYVIDPDTAAADLSISVSTSKDESAASEDEGEEGSDDDADSDSEADDEAKSDDGVIEPEGDAADEPAAEEGDEPAAEDEGEKAFESEATVGGFLGLGFLGGVTVQVSAEEGVVPEGTTVKATLLDSAAYDKAIEDAIGMEVSDSVAIDVTLVDSEGSAIQPDGSVTVTFLNNGVQGDTLGVYRVSDDASDVTPISASELSSESATFDVDHFSVYDIVGFAFDNTSTYASYTISLDVGDTTTISGNGNSSHSWSVNEEGIISLANTSSSKPTVTGLAPGTVILTHSYKSWGSTYTDTYTVTVNAVIPTTAIDIEEETATVYYNSSNKNPTNAQLAVTLHVTTDPDEASVTWSSSDTSVATVDQNGVVTATGTGTVTITATSGGLSDTCEVTVKSTSGKTPIYIYLNASNLADYNFPNLVANSSGWYTIGYYMADSAPSASSGAMNDTIRSWVQDCVRNASNLGIPTDFLVAIAATYDLKIVTSGANDYVSSGNAWHLDLYASSSATTYPVTVNYINEATGDILETTTGQYVINAEVSASWYKKTIPGYTFDYADPESVTVSNSSGDVLNLYYKKNGSIVVSLADKTVEYNGNEQSLDDPTITGGPEGLSLENLDASVTGGTGTDAGTYEGIVSGDSTYTAENGTVYDVVYRGGTLTITKNTKITEIIADSDSKTYDGTALTDTGFSVVYDGTTIHSDASGVVTLPTGDKVTAVVEGSQTDAGSSANVVKSFAINGQAESDKFDASSVKTTDGTLTISKRPVTFTGESGTRDYTGDEIELTGVAVSSGTDEGLVSGHSHNVAASAKGTEAGNYPGTITAKDDVVIMSGDEDVTGNYDITVLPGALTINKSGAKWSVSLANDSYVYDGEAHANANAAQSTAASGTTEFAYAFSADGEYVSDLSSLTKVDAGTYTIFVKATNPNYSETAYAQATLTIDPKPVTLSTETESWEYDGAEHSAPTVSGTEDLYDRDGISVSADVTVEYVNDYKKNAITVTGDDEEGKPGLKNYAITLEEGFLAIVAPTGNDDLVVTKFHEEGDYKLGDTVQFTVEVTNIYNESKDITLRELDGFTFVSASDESATISDDGLTVVFEGVETGVTVSVTVEHEITEEDILTASDESTQTNTVTAAFGDDKYTAEDEFLVPEKDNSLGVEKRIFSVNGEEVEDPDSVILMLGDEVVYAITVTNLGNVTISDIEVEDVLTGNTGDDAFTIDELKPGESETVFTKAYVVTEDDILNNEVVNAATATGTDPEGEEPEGEGETDNPTEQKNPSIHVAKSVLTVNGDEFKGGKLMLGDEVVYKLIVTNNGNVTISDIVVTDELTGNTGDDVFTIDELMPGESVELTTEPYVVTEADILAGVVRNEATATGTDPKGEEPEVVPGTDEKPTDDPKGKVSISKRSSSTPDNGRFYVEGERISYEITATNTGTLTVNNLVVTDDLTGDKWTVKALAPGESKTFKATYTVKASDVRKGEVVNVATGFGSTVDPETPPTVVPGDTTDPTGSNPTPGPGIAPDDPIYPVVNTLQQLVEPLHEEPATVIDDDGTPQAGFDHIACWVHYYIILGMILTAIYGAAVIARRSNNSRRLQKLDDAALGKDETAQTQGTETVKEA